MSIQSNGRITAIYTVLGTLIVFFITTLTSYIYTSSNNIVALQQQVSHLSTQMSKVTQLLELKGSDKWNIDLLKQNFHYLEQQVKPFLQYGDRFSKQDYEEREKKVILYVDNKADENKKYCQSLFNNARIQK